MTIKNGVKLIKAYLKGDNVEVTSLKNQAKFESAIALALSQKTHERLRLVDVLDDAKEAQQLALVNGGAGIKTQTDGEEYIEGLLEAAKNVVEAEDAITELDAQIACLKKANDELTKDVEDED